MTTGHDASLAPGEIHVPSGRPITADEFFAFPSDGKRLELVAGEVKEMSPSGHDHGTVMLQLGYLLKDFAKAHGIKGFSGGDVGFILARNPDTVLAPDISFVRSERIPKAGCPKFFDGPPDLAVEIVSPGDRPAEVEAKARHWIGCGASLVWVVNGTEKTVDVYAVGRERRTISLDGQLDGGDVLPGFTATLREIFEC